MVTEINWTEALQPLIQKYKERKHPLNYENMYQLLVMIILSAQDSDANVNQLAPAFFEAFPDFNSLAKASAEAINPFVYKTRNANQKSKWLVAAAIKIKLKGSFPLTMEELITIPGIGRKAANIIIREAKLKAEGIFVDNQVIRVANRLDIANSEEAKKVEKQLMEKIEPFYWDDVGMAMSFLGRETCRPVNPKHSDCVMSDYCAYFAKLNKEKR